MRILFVLEHFYPFVGGVAILFEELAKELQRLGCTVTVVTTRLPGTVKHEIWEGITIERVWTPPFSRRYWFTMCALPRLWQLARHSDILQTTTYNAALPSWLVAQFLRKPIFLTVHEVWGQRWFTYPVHRLLASLYFLIERFIIRLPYTGLVSVSDATAIDLQKSLGKNARIQRIYNGIDTQLFRPSKAQIDSLRTELGLTLADFVFFYYGRPGISKGLEYLINAFVQICDSEPRARLLLVVAADPPDRYRVIRDMIDRSSHADRIRLHPPVARNQLPRYLTLADCVVVPSLAEGFGFTAAEACAVGRPIIVTRVGSLPEVVSGHVLFAPPGDVTGLAEQLKQALHGAFQSLPPKQFSWTQAAQEYVKLYRKYL